MVPGHPIIGEDMATSTDLRDERAPAARCAVCRHAESEHGKTGTRPCLAMVGSLLRREFCACDRYQSKATAEVPAISTAAQPVAHKPAA